MRNFEQSVVRISVISKPVDWYHPWEYRYQQTFNGSGCIVSGDRILTVAHLVIDAVTIQVSKSNDVRSYAARVIAVDHESELALLGVDDPSFFADTSALSVGGLPARHASLAVWGYPSHGKEVCITSGVVSRIEVTEYTQSGRQLLAIQTDAAINPGNSGGPVFLGEEFVGVAFQAHEAAHFRRSGFVIPAPVIAHFFADMEDGRIGGVPELGVQWQRVESESLRRFLGITGDLSGVLVTNVVFDSSVWGSVQAGDVIVAIDRHRVECDGSVALDDGLRVEFVHVVSSRQVGDAIAIEILRDGKRLQVEVTLRKYTTLVRPSQPDVRPTYFIGAGLVFQPLSYDYILEWGWEKADCRLKSEFQYGSPSPDRHEIVLLSHVLAHDVNTGYHDVKGAVVATVNGRTLRNMKELVAAFENPIGGFHVIKLDCGGIRGYGSYASPVGWIVIDAERATAVSPEILERHGIHADRSADLVPVSG